MPERISACYVGNIAVANIYPNDQNPEELELIVSLRWLKTKGVKRVIIHNGGFSDNQTVFQITTDHAI